MANFFKEHEPRIDSAALDLRDAVDPDRTLPGGDLLIAVAQADLGLGEISPRRLDDAECAEALAGVHAARAYWLGECAAALGLELAPRGTKAELRELRQQYSEYYGSRPLPAEDDR